MSDSPDRSPETDSFDSSAAADSFVRLPVTSGAVSCLASSSSAPRVSSSRRSDFDAFAKRSAAASRASPVEST